MFELKLQNLYFDEPRLKMGHSSRFFSRLIIYSFYVILFVGDITFLLSSARQLFFVGLLISLFLTDRLIHFGQAERSLVGLIRYLPRLSRRGKSSDPGRINVANFFTPKSFYILEKSFEKALFLGGNFHLYLLENILSQAEIQKGFLRLDVSLKDVNQKLREFIKEAGDKKCNPLELWSKLDMLAKSAFVFAFYNKNRFVAPWDLFSALANIEDPLISRFFGIFAIDASDLEKTMIFSRFYKKIS